METKDFKTHIVKPKDDGSQALRPPLAPKSKEDKSEIENARDRDGQLNSKRRKLDQLSEQLGQTSYIAKPRISWLQKKHVLGAPTPLTVSRFYPNLKLLIDISVNEKADSDENVMIKKMLCKVNGFHYYELKSAEDIHLMFATLPSQGT